MSTPQEPQNHTTESVLEEDSVGRLRGFLLKIYNELGVASVVNASVDVKLLLIQRAIRLFAYGGSVLVLVSYLAALGISESRIGLFMTLTLVGDIVIGLFLTMNADRLGRRAILIAGALLMTASGVCFALSDNYWILLAAAVFGVISPAGNEIGPFRAIEESIIASVTAKEELGSVYAWYTLVGQVGTALGMMFCGWLASVLQSKGKTFVFASRMIFVVYAVAGILKLLFTFSLSAAVEAERPKPRAAGESAPLLQDTQGTGGDSGEEVVTPKKKKWTLDGTHRLVFLLTIFFGLDNFASGLATLSWITFFFKNKFHLSEGTLGSIFFTTSIIAAVSALVSASIAKRLGNIKTMVFTHLPSSIMLALIPIPSELPVALALLIGRACTQQMDVGPRSAFLAMVLPPEQRTAIMGFLNVVKICSSSFSPFITGILAEANLFWVAFLVAGLCKATYDLGMLATFAGLDKRASA